MRYSVYFISHVFEIFKPTVPCVLGHTYRKNILTWCFADLGCFNTTEYTLNGYNGIMFNLRALTNDVYLRSFGVRILDDSHDALDVLVYVTSDGTAAEVREVFR